MTAGRVLVTGASGFVGSHVVRTLAAHGHTVRVLLRGSAPEADVWPAGVEVARARGLDDAGAVAAAVEGCRAVVHLAGRAHLLGPAAGGDAEFDAVNVAGTLAVAREAARTGVALFVHASSAGAVATSSAEVLAAAVAPAPDTAYGRSKLRAERELRELAAGSATAFVSLRPPMVYGPGMRGNPLRLFHLVARGVPLPVGRVRNQRSMIYVENLAEVVAAMLGRTWRGAEELFVADGPPLSTAEFARRAGDALGRSARIVNVPLPVLRAAAAAAGTLGRRAGIAVDASTVDRLTSSLVIDDAPLRDRLGPVPRVPLDSAFARTAAWYRRHRAAVRSDAPATTDPH